MSTINIKPGDKVRLTLDHEFLEGILMPSTENSKNTTMIKLKSGYNIGIDNSRIKKQEVLEELKTVKRSYHSVESKKGLPTISILHTGGTIASKVDYRTGGVIARFTPEEIVEIFPEINNIANIKSRLLRNMWSEDMRFAHHNLIAKEIEKEISSGADGIIVTHGTDTMHYSSTALSFILENLGIPVILVGSQRSSDRGSSDAGLNLISAVYFAANSDFGEVGICMHESMSDNYCSILPACKTRKMNTSRRDAFRAINSKPKARVNVEKKEIIFTDKYNKKDTSKKLNIKLIDEKLRIGILKFHTNMFADEVLNYKDYDGLVLEGFALGQGPINEIDEFTKENTRVREALKMIANKIPTVMSSQCIYGRINMNVYQTGRDMQALGVIGNFSDLTPETSFIKLSWLLSNHPHEIKDLFTKNLRGELSERIKGDEF